MASKKMERVISAYKHAAQMSSPVAGNIIRPLNGNVTISSIWGQRNIERKSVVHSELIQVADLNTKEVRTFTSTDISSELTLAYSKTNNYRGLIRDIPASGKSPKKQHLEVWKGNKLLKYFDLTGFEVHGDVCTDSEFGSFKWSDSEDKLLYVAERKQPKSEPFLPSKKSSKDDDESRKGCEYELVEDWGEQLVGKALPVPCVCDLEKESVSVLSEGLPEDVSVGQVIWAPDGGIIGVAWETKPWRLGLIYCTNRESFIFHLTPDGELRKLSTENLAVRCPSLSPDKTKLVWLERNVGGPHHAGHRLMIYDWAKKELKVLVDLVEDETLTNEGLPFFGIYCQDLGKCWVSNDKLVFSTPQRASVNSFVVDIGTGKVSCLRGDNEDTENLTVLDAKDNLILAVRSSLKTSPCLLLGSLSDGLPIKWLPLVEQEPLVNDVEVGVLRIDAKTLPETVSKYSALYMVPSNASDAPFIVWSHGGPHSGFTNGTSVMAQFFASLGFGMVMVNYRGSTGAGERSLNFLPGKIGTTDVADCQQAAEAVLDQFSGKLSREKCVLFGGSHGGFLSLQLSAQFPTKYKGCVALNPVVDLTSFSGSDIPDWGAVEGGFEFTPKLQMTPEMFKKMQDSSPLSRVSAVTAPTLLLLGKKDLRVPMSQGVSYYRQLKAKGVKTRMLVYDDNHTLSQLPHEIDFAINTIMWFEDSFNQSS